MRNVPENLLPITNATAGRGDHWITINGKKIAIPEVVRHGIVFQTLFVAVLAADHNGMRNFLAFDGEGNRLWTIEKPDFEAEGVGYALVNGDDNILMALCRGVGLS